VSYFPTDPIELAAQARDMLTKLHERKDVVVKFATDNSGFFEDAVDEEVAEGGHYSDAKKVLRINLDKVLDPSKPAPSSLKAIEDWRLYPVLAGVAAHESAHAKYTRWHDTDENPFPETLINPDYDPAHPVRMIPNPDYDTHTGDKTADDLSRTLPPEIEDIDYRGPESFPVKEQGGKLIELAKVLEEPRVERLARTHFTKTWRKALEFSASHLTLESVDEMDDDEQQPLDAAVNLAVLVGGRMNAGTLGVTQESRTAAQKVQDSAQKIIEASLPNVADPFHKIMGIVSEAVFDNEHDDANSHLDAARRILAIVHPESTDNPDSGKPNGAPMPGAGDSAEGAGDDAEGQGTPELTEEQKEALAEALADAQSALDEMGGVGTEAAKNEAEREEQEQQESGGYGSPERPPHTPPQIDHYEEPTSEDRQVYRRAKAWMERQIEPTIIESEYGQWMPGGGSRLNVRGFIRDNLAEHSGTQRTDWDRPDERIKPAPPIRVAIMLDGSGSMGRQARFSASIAWAVSNAAADLTGSGAKTVSVVFGNQALLTQAPGAAPTKNIAVARTNGSTENWIEAKKLVEEHLGLNEVSDEFEGQPSNTLIVVVSDLMFYGKGQAPAAGRDTRDWIAKGYHVVNVGCDYDKLVKQYQGQAKTVLDAVISGGIELTKPENLFR
jgi:hypothetical protein